MLKNTSTRLPFFLGIGAISCLLAPFLTGCTSVSPQAVVLSEVVSQRTVTLQQSHEAFVRGYFDQSRSRIDDFLVERWTPIFLESFVHDASGSGEDLLHLLENVTPFDQTETDRLASALAERGISDTAAAVAAFQDALGGGERGEVVLEFAEAAVAQIESKRRKLLEPIDDLERRTLQELRSSYAQIQQVQSSLTGHLRSLVDVQKEQDQILRRVGMLEKRDPLIQRAITVNEGVTGILQAGQSISDTLTALEENVRNVDGALVSTEEPGASTTDKQESRDESEN